MSSDRPSSERILDAAIECTFPASDPVSIQSAFDAARERERGAEELSASAGSEAVPR